MQVLGLQGCFPSLNLLGQSSALATNNVCNCSVVNTAGTCIVTPKNDAFKDTLGRLGMTGDRRLAVIDACTTKQPLEDMFERVTAEELEGDGTLDAEDMHPLSYMSSKDALTTPARDRVRALGVTLKGKHLSFTWGFLCVQLSLKVHNK